ncbi:MAG: BadF/BadG/BcrA/BcrD ATPase family protein [Thermomicrobiales bacterium]
MASNRLLLAIDGGQTSTKAIVARLDGTVIGSGRGSASDHFHIEGGIEKNRKAIRSATSAALAAAGATADRIVSIALGLTGCPPEGEPRQPVYDILREIVTPEQIWIGADYITNLTGASAGGPGVVLVAGGGAISYGVTADGREALAGGFGYLLGDEGSAFKIGVAAIRAASRAEDRRGEPTVLEQMVRDYFEIPQIRLIPRIVYRAGFQRDRISLLTPLVAEAADGGDRIARDIILDAGTSIAEMALGIARQLFQPDEQLDVYYTGGVFNVGAMLFEGMKSTLDAGWNSWALLEPRFPPAVGALILAARGLSISTDEAWLERVKTSLNP